MIFYAYFLIHIGKSCNADIDKINNPWTNEGAKLNGSPGLLLAINSAAYGEITCPEASIAAIAFATPVSIPL